MALGGKVLEYIIKAKDATKAGIDSAKGGVQKLVVHVKDALGKANKAAKETADEAERTGRAVEKAAQRAGNETKTAASAADEAVKRAREGLKQEAEQTKVLTELTNRLAEAKKRLAHLKGSAVEKHAAAEVKALERAVGSAGQSMDGLAATAKDAVGKMAGSFLGLPGPIGNVFQTIVKAGGGAFAAIGAAIMAAWKIGSVIADRMAEKWRTAAKIASDNWKGMANSIQESFERATKQIDRANEALARAQANSEKETVAKIGVGNAKAQAEREREIQRMLAEGASSADIAAKRKEWGQDDELRSIDEEAAAVARERRDIETREQRRKLAQAELDKQIKEAEDKIREANAAVFGKLQERAREADTSLWPARRQRILEEVQGMIEGTDAVTKAAFSKLIQAQDKKYGLDTERENDESASLQLQYRAEAIRAQRESVQLAHDNAEAVEEVVRAEEEVARAEQEAERERVRAAQEAEREIERMERERERAAQERLRAELEAERKLHAQKVSDARAELQASQQAQQAAQGRLAAAQNQVAQAWGWYRDKDSMQAHIDDVLEQRAAEKQWEKDFKKLQSRFRGDTWKNVDIGKLSAEEEAVRQVALAKEEQAAAQKALDAIEENTRDLAEKLDELLTMKEA